MKDDQVRERLLAAGVRNLKQYGYPSVDAENILQDQIYSMFFRSMLNDNLGAGDQIDAVIKSLRDEIDAKARGQEER